jgi:hypothetical protein
MIVTAFSKPFSALLLLRPNGVLDLDFYQQICKTLRPISRAADELPPIYDIGGMKRNLMHRTSPYLTAPSVAKVWSFNRPSKRLGMCPTIEGFVSQTRHGLKPRQTG